MGSESFGPADRLLEGLLGIVILLAPQAITPWLNNVDAVASPGGAAPS